MLFDVSADRVDVDGPHGLVGRAARRHLFPYVLRLLGVSVEVREVVCPVLTILSGHSVHLKRQLNY